MWATGVTKHIEKKSKTTLPLEKHIANMRNFFVQQRHEIPELQKKVEELKIKKSKMTKRFQYRMKLDVDIEIAAILEEIEVRKSMSREHEYEHMIAPYMTAYNQRVEIEDSCKEMPRNITAPGFGKKRETIDTYVQHRQRTLFFFW